MNKPIKKVVLDLFLFVCLIFASGLLNSFLFSLAGLNFYSAYAFFKIVLLMILFRKSSFYRSRLSKYVYLGFVLVVIANFLLINSEVRFIPNESILYLDLFGILIIASSYLLYLLRTLGYQLLFTAKFGLVVAEVLRSCLFFKFVSGQVSIVQLAWISLFSLSLVIYILVRKLMRSS